LIVFQCKVPPDPAISATFYETVDEHGHKREQKKADEPKDNGKKEDKEMVVTTHIYS